MFIKLLENQQSIRPTNLHYLLRLLKVLDTAKETKYISGHLHHILPKCNSWFPCYSKEKDNLIMLPPRLHFLVHHLMHKAFPKDKSMYTAFWNMSHLNKGIKLTARQYENLRQLHSDNMRENNPAKVPGAMDSCRGENNPAKRPEVRHKISIASKARANLPENLDKVAKLGRANKGKRTGDENPARNAATRLKISQSLVGKKKPLIQCMHCSMRSSATNIKRWHNDNCRLRR